MSKTRNVPARVPAPGEDITIDLDRFLPYRLSTLAESVSHALAAIYRDRFDLTRPEWRILATLALESGLSANEIGRRVSLDKMQVSRAVQALEKKGDVARRADPRDNRSRRLELTPQGRRLYARIAPLALERETVLLSVLSRVEQDALIDMMNRIGRQAAALQRDAEGN